MVTGANNGLGLEVAKALAALGMSVVMGVRDARAGEGARSRIVRELEQEEGLKGVHLVVERVDQSSFESVRRFAEAVRRRSTRLDSLVCNAGIWANQSLTPDGISQTAQVNHYSGFLLVNLLYPLVRAASGRVVVVSSGMARSAVDFRSDLRLLDPSLLVGRGDRLYGSSKLMNILHAKEMARRCGGKCIVNSVMPGIFPTALHRAENEPASARFFTEYIAPIAYNTIGITARDAALSSVFLATLTNDTGLYFHGALPRKPPTPLADDDSLAKALWKASVEITGSDLEE